MNVGRKILTYSKAVGLSALIGLSSCAKKEAPRVKVNQVVKQTTSSTTNNLLSMLERGDRHSVMLANVPKDERVVSLRDFSKYVKNDSIGELFYQVYVGKADVAIRKASGKKGTLVTVGQGVTGKECITLAGGLKAYKGDYISAHSADSIMNLAVNEKTSIITSNVGDSVYNALKNNEKDAIISYLYNIDPSLLKNAPKGKSFFQYLKEGNKGMVQSKFNVSPSSKVAAAGLAKRNLIQMLIFGDGKIYSNKEAQDNFNKQLKIVRKNKKSKDLLKEVLDVVKRYGVNSENLAETESKMFPKK